jgi:tungstate transport system substrate-binding protein
MTESSEDEKHLVRPFRRPTWTRRLLLLTGVLTLDLTLAAAAAAPAEASRPITVATPAGAAAELAALLAQRFQAQTGHDVKVLPQPTPDLPRVAEEGRGGVDALLVPDRIEPGLPTRPNARAPVFTSDAVLVGSRTDKARVRGQRDIRTALRWIANARALTTASSPQLGLRGLELSLWDAIDVDVRSRTTWYEPGEDDENGTFARAAASGSYVLVERMTWAAQRDRRGLQLITAGDPVLVTSWSSLLLSAAGQSARAWHDWLTSEAGRRAIREVEINGIAPLTPVTGSTSPTDPGPRRAPDPS